MLMDPLLERTHLLKRSSLFCELSDESLAQVSTRLTQVPFEAGARIITQGETGDAMFIIGAGRVRVHDGERTLDELAAGSVFGEMSALDPEPRSASVTASEPAVLYRLDAASLRELMALHPEIAHATIRVVCQRLRARLRDMHEDYEYIQQFARVISAAVALEEGTYEAATLDPVARRGDPLGQLARVFQRMAQQVQQREAQLKQQVLELRIEVDQARQAKQVAEITESDYFKTLRGQADALRDIIEG